MINIIDVGCFLMYLNKSFDALFCVTSMSYFEYGESSLPSAIMISEGHFSLLVARNRISTFE